MLNLIGPGGTCQHLVVEAPKIEELTDSGHQRMEPGAPERASGKAAVSGPAGQHPQPMGPQQPAVMDLFYSSTATPTCLFVSGQFPAT